MLGSRGRLRYIVTTSVAVKTANVDLVRATLGAADQLVQSGVALDGACIGTIRSANQGMIQIFGEDGNDESAPLRPTSTRVKKIRVVRTFEFELC